MIITIVLAPPIYGLAVLLLNHWLLQINRPMFVSLASLKLPTTFASPSSVIKIRAPNRDILTIELQRLHPDEPDDWTPWQSSLLLQGNRTDKRKTGSIRRNIPGKAKIHHKK